MNAKQNAKIIVKKMIKSAREIESYITNQKTLADFFGITEGSLSGSIGRGEVPETWFNALETKLKLTKEDIMSTELNESEISKIIQKAGRDANFAKGNVTSIGDIDYKGETTPQNPQSTERGGEVGSSGQYFPSEFHRLCLVKFEEVFDYISEKYGSDARSIERFKKDYLLSDPRFRQWLYGDVDKDDSKDD